jgi:hypothetical protein
MILEIAKWQYRADNPSRSRVPRGFADDISLKLTGVDDGSAIPIICLHVATTLNSAVGLQYFEKAKYALIEAIGSAEKDSKIELPPKLLSYFDRFGRSLGANESFEFDSSLAGSKVSLNRESRRRLVLASGAKKIEAETSVHGLVYVFDQYKQTFQLLLMNGACVKNIPVSKAHYDTILDAHVRYRDKARIRVDGIGSFDRNYKLEEITSIDRISLLDPLDITVRIDELELLEDGWHDGYGVKLSQPGLVWLEDSFASFYPDDLPLPYLFPTLDGNVLAEWTLGNSEASLEVNLTEMTGEWHLLDLVTDNVSEETLPLSTAGNWEELSKIIRSLGGI